MTRTSSYSARRSARALHKPVFVGEHNEAARCRTRAEEVIKDLNLHDRRRVRRNFVGDELPDGSFVKSPVQSPGRYVRYLLEAASNLFRQSRQSLSVYRRELGSRLLGGCRHFAFLSRCRRSAPRDATIRLQLPIEQGDSLLQRGAALWRVLLGRDLLEVFVQLKSTGSGVVEIHVGKTVEGLAGAPRRLVSHVPFSRSPERSQERLPAASF